MVGAPPNPLAMTFKMLVRKLVKTIGLPLFAVQRNFGARTGFWQKCHSEPFLLKGSFL
jgi:hypothetical protein